MLPMSFRSGARSFIMGPSIHAQHNNEGMINRLDQHTVHSTARVVSCTCICRPGVSTAIMSYLQISTGTYSFIYSERLGDV